MFFLDQKQIFPPPKNSFYVQKNQTKKRSFTNIIIFGPKRFQQWLSLKNYERNNFFHFWSKKVKKQMFLLLPPVNPRSRILVQRPVTAWMVAGEGTYSPLAFER